MLRELLQTTPLVMLPMIALFLFMGVWVAALVRVMTRSRQDLAEAARLPLGNEETRYE